MNRAAAVGLAAIVFMFLEPWIKPWLDRRPRPRPEPPRRGRRGGYESGNTPASELAPPTQMQTPIRGTLLRPGRELDRGDR